MHAERVKHAEDLEASLAGVFDQQAQDQRDRFESLVHRVIQPAFENFKAVVRQVGRDAVIISSLSHTPTQSIKLVLVDRYVKLGIGKTLNLVNPKDDVTKKLNARFYEIYRVDELLIVRQRAVPHTEPTCTQVTYQDVDAKLLEEDLACFFEQAYPPAA